MTNIHENPDSEYVAVLRKQRGRIQDLIDELISKIEALQGQRDSLEEQMHHLDALIGDQRATHGQPTAAADSLAVADLVVQLLEDVHEPLHYREIERLLRERGFVVGSGKDPANTLLARYFNDPRLYRPSRGTYAPRAWARTVQRSVGARRRRSTRKAGA